MFRAGSNTDSNPLSLLKRVLTTRDPELLQQLRKRAAEVVAALDAEDEDFTEAESKVVAEDPRWLAQVYEVLGAEGDAEEDAEESEIEAAIDEIHDNQDREIAQAFQILTKYLPGRMMNWGAWFGKVPEVSDATSSTLCKRWSELGAGRDIQELTRYGITPATFYEATVGLELLLERCIAESNAGTASVLLLEFMPHITERPTDRRQVVVGRDQLLAQMRSSPDCPPGADEPLLRWTCSAAARRSRIFEGFQVLGMSDPVLAVAYDPSNRNRDLMHRWSYDSSTHSEEQEQHVAAAKTANS